MKKKLKRGDVRADGMVFWEYTKRTKSGQYWVTADHYAMRMEKAKLAQKKWRDANPEKSRAMVAKSKSTRPEREASARKVAQAELAKRRAYRQANREKLHASHRRWVERNRARDKARKEKRRAVKRQQLSPVINTAIVVVFYQTRDRLAECLGIPFHVDHIVPLAKGGLHCHTNLQVIPATINLEKSARGPFVWASQNFADFLRTSRFREVRSKSLNP